VKDRQLGGQTPDSLGETPREPVEDVLEAHEDRLDSSDGAGGVFQNEVVIVEGRNRPIDQLIVTMVVTRPLPEATPALQGAGFPEADEIGPAGRSLQGTAPVGKAPQT
jgi:hypothetical protein